MRELSPAAIQASSVTGLAPGLLVASPPLGDPNFDRAVVLLALHGESGALGFVVNRVSPVTLAELLSLGGYGELGEGDPTPVYIGGPVQPGSGWILTAGVAPVPATDPAPGTEAGEDEGVLRLSERVCVTSSRRGFDDLARDVELCRGAAGEAPAGANANGEGAGGARRIVLLGYSGWGPGQLEREIAAGAWLPVPFDEGVLFDVAVEEKWERAYALLGLTPSAVMSMNRVGEA